MPHTVRRYRDDDAAHSAALQREKCPHTVRRYRDDDAAHSAAPQGVILMVDQKKQVPGRPGRLKWVFNSSPVYFITFCTHHRQTLLDSNDVHSTFMESAQKSAISGVAVGRYVIMPDHIHLFARVAPEARLGLAIKHLKERITKQLHKKDSGLHVWQTGFFDHVLRSNESYSEKWDYVRYNPVRAGLADDPDQWMYAGQIMEIRW